MPKRGRSAVVAPVAGEAAPGRRGKSQEAAEAREVGFAWDKKNAKKKAGKGKSRGESKPKEQGGAETGGAAGEGKAGAEKAARRKSAPPAANEEDGDAEEEDAGWDGGWSSSDDDAEGKSPSASSSSGAAAAAAVAVDPEVRFADHIAAARARSARRKARAAVEGAFANAELGAQLASSAAEPSRRTAEGRRLADAREQRARDAAALRARLPVSSLNRRVAVELGVLPPGLEAADTTGDAGRATRRDAASLAAAAALGPASRSAPMGAGTADAASLMMHADDLSSDDEAPKNTAGASVPREWYAGLPIIGYDVSGRAIARSEGKDRIERFLQSQEDPLAHRWTVYDSENDEEVALSARDVAMVRSMREGGYAHPEFDETSDAYNLTDLFSVHDPDDAGPAYSSGDYEPKRRFLPSRWEAMRVNKLRKAIREGRLRLRTDEERKEDLDPKKRERDAREPEYSLWGADGNAVDPDAPDSALSSWSAGPRGRPDHIAAPKPRPPGHAASYRPPREYLLTDAEREVWRRTARHRRPAGLEGDMEPTRYDALRHVPVYTPLLRERFERCLDLYLAPRHVRKRLNVADVTSLLPKLPDPRELRPFPTTAAVEYLGHTGRVRCVDVSPDGQFLATGGDDGSLRVWDLETGRELRCWRFADVASAREAEQNATTAMGGEGKDSDDEDDEADAAAGAAAARGSVGGGVAAAKAAAAEASAAATRAASTLVGGGSVIVTNVRWNPNPSCQVIIAAVGRDVVVLYPGLASPGQLATTHRLLAGTSAEAARQGADTIAAAAARRERLAAAVEAAGDDETAKAEAIARVEEEDAEAAAAAAVQAARRLATAVPDVHIPGDGGDEAGGMEDAVNAEERAALDAEAAPRPLEAQPDGEDVYNEAVDGTTVPKTKRRFVRWLWLAGGADLDAEDIEDGDADVAGGAASGPAVSNDTYRRYAISSASLASPEALGRPGTGGVVACLRHHSAVRALAWHPKGDYAVTVCPAALVAPVLLHQLTKRRSQFPFTEAGGLSLRGAAQTAIFHPDRPELLVATRRAVHRFSLADRERLQKLRRGPKWISCLAMHPEGEHLVVGGFDRRVSWFDTEVAESSWRTLRYHEEAVRDAAFHPGSHPLLATTSDDGRVQVFHARPPLPADMSMDPVIVPVKILRPCPRTEDGLATLALAWHPTQPWLVTASADGRAVLHQDIP